MYNSLKQLGFNDKFAERAAQYGIGQPYRITEDFGLRFVVSGEGSGQPQGQPQLQPQLQRFDLIFARKNERAPIIGDWILGIPTQNGAVEFVDILERATCFQRGNGEDRVQALAANIDKLFIVTSCTDEFNLSRLERYLLLAHANRLTLVIVLNKADLVEEKGRYVDQIAELGAGIALCVLSTFSESGVTQLKHMMMEGETCVFVGSSGVGKSSIVNALIVHIDSRRSP